MHRVGVLVISGPTPGSWDDPPGGARRFRLDGGRSGEGGRVRTEGPGRGPRARRVGGRGDRVGRRLRRRLRSRRYSGGGEGTEEGLGSSGRGPTRARTRTTRGVGEDRVEQAGATSALLRRRARGVRGGRVPGRALRPSGRGGPGATHSRSPPTPEAPASVALAPAADSSEIRVALLRGCRGDDTTRAPHGRRRGWRPGPTPAGPRDKEP